MRPLLSLVPQTARQARLLRLADRLAREQVPGAPVSEADKLVWATSHARLQDDKRLSAEEERLREPKLPLQVADGNTLTSHGTTSGGNLFQYREHPMFPGEYVPPGHDSLSSLRAELKADLTAQSLREAWTRVSDGAFFEQPSAFYGRVEGLDEVQLGEVVAALFPTLGPHDSRALVRRVLESLSKPENTPARRLAQAVTAESVGLDASPGHYANFVEWMGRIMDTPAFRTEHAIFQFCRRRFNRSDVQHMWENYNLVSKEALAADKADGYSHFHALLKDFSSKIAGRDTRPQLGVRIDPSEVDPKTGMSFGVGVFDNSEVIAVIRENRDKTGEIFAQGKPIQETLDNSAWLMEQVLWVFDEAGLDSRDFDVYFMNKGATRPRLATGHNFVLACRLGLARAVSKMLPVTRIKLKKAGLLTVSRIRTTGDDPGFLDKKFKRRPFYKR